MNESNWRTMSDGQSSKGSLAILGACLLVLPWILMGSLVYLGFVSYLCWLRLRSHHGLLELPRTTGPTAALRSIPPHILTARELEIVSKARAKHSNEETAKESFRSTAEESFRLTYRELQIVDRHRGGILR